MTDLLNVFRETFYGEIALDGTINEAMDRLGMDREFFKRIEMDYANPDFRTLRRAVILYREERQILP